MNDEKTTLGEVAMPAEEISGGATETTVETTVETTEDTPVQPAAEEEASAATTNPLGLPPLGLWEMLEVERTQSEAESDDEASRVLSGLRSSVWDACLD